tara:strand:- start:54 stop:992 length:939 start_codon:yes stop_codon:yes gene_type:complete
MKILVTGGSGFIGKNYILKRLDEYPDDVILNVDKLTYASNKEDIVDERYEHKKIDICSKRISKVISDFKPDSIVHFAAESHVDNSIDDPSDFIKTNVVGTFNLLKNSLEYYKNNKKFRFLHVSTDEVYGSLGETGKFKETTSYDPKSPYSAAKASSDHLVRAYCHTYGFPGMITNCSNNYGPYQHKEKFIPKIISKMRYGGIIPVYGDGKNVRDWLYVEDHCDALNIVLDKGKIGETYNIGGDCEMENNEILAEVSRTIGVGKYLMSYVTDRLGHDFRYAIDHSKITKELGWKPKTKFKDGIKKTVEWYLNE